ncbi:uncharacterized protein LOC122886145 isoform X2 [Siniperca chuatsi]|uniref:uncharacterized protein LOC122886145 isoform X2 n=1 Tax=Siniperca chuatsi TaxID=119488 RepID=UPI001CE0C24B|nr:uncharacterized protein LOC122886145 isoform X2 [Siniperca chuatsi]
MVKFQSDFFCLHVIMFSLNQAALLFIQLLLTYQVFAVLGTHPFDHRDVLVSRGDSVMFTCNISNANTTQINWTKGRSVFAYSILHNQTFSNFTSHRLRIDLNLPSKLNIFNAQHDDAGLYVCNVAGKRGLATTEWNLTVSEKPEEISPSWYFLYMLTPAIGFLLCGFTPAVCLCRKLRTRTPNQNPVQDQFHLQSEGEVVLRQPQGGTDSRTNNQQRSQYMERVNSIYGL